MSLSTSNTLPSHRARRNGDLRPFAACVCAAAAGVHTVLAPAHLHESTLLGLAFALDAVLLGSAALALRRQSYDSRLPFLVAGLLSATAIAYILSRTSGLPVLAPDPERLDALGLVTTLLELAGAAACLLPTLRKEPA